MVLRDHSCIVLLVLLLALLKVRALILDHGWSARYLSWCGRPRYKFPYKSYHEFLNEWDRIITLLDNAPNEVPNIEVWTMVPDTASSSIDRDLPNPEQPVNIFTLGSIEGSTKLHVVPNCRGLALKNQHVCRLSEIMGIGNEYWCKHCTSIGNIIDDDPELLLEL